MLRRRERPWDETAGSRLRLQKAVRLRWFGVIGQLLTVGVVYLLLGFQLPLGICLAFIALSAWLNVFLRIRFPARTRLSTGFATSLLAYDILQLAALLFLTGGADNPFIFLLVAPVTVSAATQPPRNTIALGLLGAGMAVLLLFYSMPLPWYPGSRPDLPMLYSVGVLASVLSGMVFLALYAWRLAKEARQMSDALAATELVLAREQQLHALDGLAAAAAHELGTPLSTIAVIAKELAREPAAGGQFADDIALLQAQAMRCREILTKLTRSPSEPDPLHARMSVTQLIDEAAEPYRSTSSLSISAEPEASVDGEAALEPVGERKPGVIYGLSNLIENAVDFARQRVEIVARWSARDVLLTISDDGPGIPLDVLDALGEPYITTRGTRRAGQIKNGEPTGLGLGFFIAKTLLERSGAAVTLENRQRPDHGAVVTVSWPRQVFESKRQTAQGWDAQAPKTLVAAHERGIG
jgi:two-component system, sensor histidine kinase RegB